MQGVVSRAAHQPGHGAESIRGWVKPAEIDAGQGAGGTAPDQRRIAELEQEVRELRRASLGWDSSAPS